MEDGAQLITLERLFQQGYRKSLNRCIYQIGNIDEPLDLDELLNTLGLLEHKNKFPSQLSGGQQQRYVIARALIKNRE